MKRIPNPIRRHWLIAAGLMACAALAIAQTPMVNEHDGDDGKLIEDAFKALQMPAPQLGWVLPNGDLVTEVVAKEVTILARDSAPRIAPRIGIIPAKEVPAFVRKNEVDCDQMDEKSPPPLYRYAAKLPSSKLAVQVLVLPGRFSMELRASHEEYKPTEAQLDAVGREIKLIPGQKHLLHAIRQINGSQPAHYFFYTYATIYGKDGIESRQGVFLQDQTGKILGRQIEELNEENTCDGCGLSSYKDDRHSTALSINLISIPTLPYPLVLQDSSTIEGRAIDLFTFSASGQPSHLRAYEYMVTCVLGDQP